MTHQGARARPQDNETGRVYEVSKIRLDTFRHISDVLWCEIDSRSDHEIGPRSVVAVADVVDAIHSGARVFATFEAGQERIAERQFAVVEHSDGRETLILEGAQVIGRQLSDMARLQG